MKMFQIKATYLNNIHNNIVTRMTGIAVVWISNGIYRTLITGNYNYLYPLNRTVKLHAAFKVGKD
jgi:hypothetical protein